MMKWYSFALISLFFFGIQRFLYKVSAERNCNTTSTTFSFMATVAILSSILFFSQNESISNLYFLLFISFVNSASFTTSTISTIEALKHISASIAYPIIRLNTVIVVIFSIVYFKDRLSLYQAVGIICAIAVILLLTRNSNEHDVSDKNVRLGFILISISVVSGAIAAISSKFAAIHTSKMGYIAISYTLSMFFSLIARKGLKQQEGKDVQKSALLIGFCMGILNFAGFYFLLQALSLGPLSIVISITGMYFIIAILLSALIYKERITLSRMIGITLTIVSLLLMRM